MEEEAEAVQLNEEVIVQTSDLKHLQHIKKRVKNQDAVTKMVVKHIKQDNYLGVGSH